MRSLIQGLLEELAEVMEALGRVNQDPGLNPSIFSWGMLTLSVLAAFSTGLLGPLAILVFSMLTASILGVEVKPLSRILAASMVLGAGPSIPLAFSNNGRVEGLGSLTTSIQPCGLLAAACLTVRVVAAAAPLSVAALYLGWPNLIRGLLPFRGGKPGSLLLIPVFVPRLARHLSTLLAAREARLIRESFFEAWRIMASAVGDMLASTGGYASMLALAVESRSIAPLKAGWGRPGLRDVLFAAICGVTAVLWAVLERCF